jgi:hypothetical protein
MQNYNIEAICLTKYTNEVDMREWLEWHLNKCHFNHIHIMDNESNYDLKSLCEEYKDRVSYELVTGVPRQFILYDDYVNNRSMADWIVPIDDDEYLELSSEFNSINDALNYYENKFPNLQMLAVRWKHLFPQKFHSERNCPVLEYCTKEHLTLASSFHIYGDLGVKTIVKRTGKIHYQERNEMLNRGHVPIHEKTNGAIAFNGSLIIKNSFDTLPIDTTDEKIRLIHCRYKGYTDYKTKYIDNTVVKIGDKNHPPKKFLFNSLLEKLD